MKHTQPRKCVEFTKGRQMLLAKSQPLVVSTSVSKWLRDVQTVF